MDRNYLSNSMITGKKQYLMGIDIGSTTIKSIIYNKLGNIESIGRIETGIPEIVAEKDEKLACWIPEKIWKNVTKCIKSALKKAGNNFVIKGVAVSAFGNDGGPIDKDGNALYPFISWQHAGTTVEMEEFLNKISREEIFSINGQAVWYASSIFRIMWLKRSRPDIYRKIHKWLLIQDFINCKLCNKFASDYSISSTTLILDQKKRQWSKKILDAAGIDKNILPKLMQSGEFLGEVTQKACIETGLRKGTPVIVGGHDNICGSLAVGGFNKDVVVDIGGTFESIILHSPYPLLDKKLAGSNLITEASVVKDLYAIYGFHYFSGCTEWIKSIIKYRGKEEFWEDFLKKVKKTRPGSSGLIFIPYLTGSYFPKDDKISGALFGLTLKVGKTEILRSLIEGLNFLSKDLLKLITKSLKRKINTLKVIGGITYNEFWMQNKADIINIPIEVPNIPEATSYGLAILAGIGSGVYRDIDDAFNHLKKPKKLYYPNESNNKIYNDIYDNIYTGLYPTIKKVSLSIVKYIH